MAPYVSVCSVGIDLMLCAIGRKRNILEVALRQSGNEAARRSLERAAAAAAASKDGSGIGIVEVRVASASLEIVPVLCSSLKT